ncbi:CoB--CoM heterodisulfide reductase iron-sulfur subunit B family protein [Desulfovibrio mangrovi]|uniref:CoB--CoM heterodisulfide reductase iron-sulfur subunit B family protein n=1 Tax=Desulfovibrio mangrovi TaxID=2976983 RepID=UPI002246133E|nr:CoB--CoM heterodisulfide reductase iron-sulfur subunit B family protein [Desulfovibrio mangrovi]UZP68548.1 CoB--CoM heterodisulfide reductase iron-sulfur subunit B family protein [Desulfovibrio mangrovi]
MRYAYFPGCKIPHHLPEYGDSVRSVCTALGIELVPVEFSCCGWPIRHENAVASTYSAVRNFAVVAQEGLPIMTPCKCCFGNLKHALARMNQDARIAAEVGNLLGKEGLRLPEKVEVFHLLTVLDKDVGAQKLKEHVRTPLSGLHVACHYGCHALRPGNVTEFDDPLAPTVFERILTPTGAAMVDWDLRLECCGHPLRGRDDTISDALMRKKLENAREAGAHVVATGCTYCQMQFEQERNRLGESAEQKQTPKAILFTRLLEAALGLKSLPA